MTALYDVKNILWNLLTTEFQSRSIDIKVTRAYPKTVEELHDKPMISIARVSGAEEIMMVSDLINQAVVSTTEQKYTETTGYLTQEIYEISIWSMVSDLRDDLMILTRQIMFEKRLYLSSNGFQKIILVGSSDEEIDVSKVPAIIYRGVLRYLIMSKVKKQVEDDVVQNVITSLHTYSSGS